MKPIQLSLLPLWYFTENEFAECEKCGVLVSRNDVGRHIARHRQLHGEKKNKRQRLRRASGLGIEMPAFGSMPK